MNPVQDELESASLLSHTEADDCTIELTALTNSPNSRSNSPIITSSTTELSEEDIMSQPLSLAVIIGIVSNILCVVGIVITNKYIIEVDNYNYSVFLSFLHFAFTALGTRVMLQLNYFTLNEAPLMGILPVAIGSLLSVAFMNLNLAHNSVGFYQVSSFFSFLKHESFFLLLILIAVDWLLVV